MNLVNARKNNLHFLQSLTSVQTSRKNRLPVTLQSFIQTYTTHAKPNRIKIETSQPILCVGFKMDFLASKLMQKHHTLLNNLWSPADEFLLKMHFAINQLAHLGKYFVSKMVWHENDTGKIEWIRIYAKVKVQVGPTRQRKRSHPLEGKEIIQH